MAHVTTVILKMVVMSVMTTFATTNTTATHSTIVINILGMIEGNCIGRSQVTFRADRILALADVVCLDCLLALFPLHGFFSFGQLAAFLPVPSA